ncbi:hypothetical protein ACMFMG_009908 [Clarireedia jacksonii]
MSLPLKALLIFNGENWNTFKSSYILVFAAARCLGIVEGTEEEPDTTNQRVAGVRCTADYQKRLRNAISILNFAVAEQYYTYILDFIHQSDIQGIWQALQKHD